MDKNKDILNIIKNDLIKELAHNKVGYDLSDIGNLIGMVIGDYIVDDSGFDKHSFILGFEHGISISTGTHFK